MINDTIDKGLFNDLLSAFLGPHAVSSDMARYATYASAAVAGGALYYYLNTQGPQPVRLIDYKKQTCEIPGRTDGARVNVLNPTDKLLSFYYEDAKTLYEVFKKGKQLSNDGNYLGWKPSEKEPYKWLKYSEVEKIAQEIGSAFIELGLEPAKEGFVGIFARNRVEWLLTEVATNGYSFTNVPLYDTLGSEAISYILVQTQLRIVVCDDSAKAIQLMNSKSSLEHIVVIEKITDEVRTKAADLGIKIHSFEELKEIGRKNLKNPIPAKPDDLATICYTSGTTGTPKGAMITHQNIVSIVSTVLFYMKKTRIILDGEERYLSYLPLAHMFERCAVAVLTCMGGEIGFYQGDVRKLIDDMKEVRPTIFCTVPRLLNRIYAKVTENLEKSSSFKKNVFKWAFAQKEKEVMRGIIRNNSIYDFAFKQIRATMGGAVKFILTGSAPVSPEILHFLRVVTGCIVIEGYGATETGGACSIQLPGETTVGNIGPPFLCSMFKLADVPEMNLVASRDNRGEILVHGTNVFKGYFKDEEKTKAALDADGWYHTGDVGSYDENGCMRVVDRVKNIFKLQQGEYIAPEKIENIYVRSKYVAQVFIYGNSYKSSLIAIIVPEETVLAEWAQQNGQEADFKKLCANAELKKLVLKDITSLGKEAGLKGFEQARDIYLSHEHFSIENGLLTPTMKAKRAELQKHFQAEIDAMYKDTE